MRSRARSPPPASSEENAFTQRAERDTIKKNKRKCCGALPQQRIGEEKAMLSNKSKAIGYIMLSAFGFALMTAFVRLAGDLPFTQKSLFRNLVAVAVAVIVLRREKCGFKWEKGNLPLLILRSTCGTLGIFCNYYAIDHLVLADANILNIIGIAVLTGGNKPVCRIVSK